MGWHDWERYESRPLRRADGIKAKTQRGQFGRTWWAGRWIAALERLVDSSRLSRGRSYARSGQVVQLDVGRDGVRAQVQGSRPRPYRVSIGFRMLSDTEWERVIDAMAAEAIYAAKLLSGEMPEQIEEAFAAAGTSLFPAAEGDLETDCSCPDWANPCKHVAAVHYLLGERFEEDPFLIFELRGRGKEEIAASLRARRAGGALVEDATTAKEPQEEDIPLLSGAVEEFWSWPGSGNLTITLEPPQADALPVKQLGPPPFWHARTDFIVLMEQAYKSIGEHALKLIVGEERPPGSGQTDS